MEIHVLGPVRVRIGDQSIVPTAGKPKQVLTLLALRCGRVVPVSTLMEEIWGDKVPRSGTTTLQTYILQLRKLIARSLPAGCQLSAKDLLVTHFNGYQLAITPSAYDLREFERLTVEGDAALAAGDAETASRQLGRALELWSGSALMDVPAGQVLEMEAMGMEEARMRAQELRIIADLQLGRHAMLIPELRMLVAQCPMHENFCAMLMIALQRSGAPWRALQVFRNLRQILIGELGVEPSSRLQRLHQAVLSNVPDLPLAAYDLA
ncbi:AfsR/SARP family transcriptional regulator [Streptomyces ferralitis]|uniref:AfsR/SARP family transcriptional regulator n=2 Tax=Streptantibioticus ferralitis TaxID=236510 RepID=A0ABT5YY29_9ACTN|nr:AfsR/SARP family transcriptional regulator [Streptantibioticus ferralitis]